MKNRLPKLILVIQYETLGTFELQKKNMAKKNEPLSSFEGAQEPPETTRTYSETTPPLELKVNRLFCLYSFDSRVCRVSPFCVRPEPIWRRDGFVLVPSHIGWERKQLDISWEYRSEEEERPRLNKAYVIQSNLVV